jgi:uncharacterized protein
MSNLAREFFGKQCQNADCKIAGSSRSVYSPALTKPLSTPATNANQLCTQCGLCCDGTIFADVQLNTPAEVARVCAVSSAPKLATTHPLRIKSPALNAKCRLGQPCPALQGRLCAIYPERPDYCRQFECLTLKQVKAGALSPAAALRAIRATRKRVAKIKGLLRKLEDVDEHLPLATRVRRTAARLEKRGASGPAREAYARLTVSMHELHRVLSSAFYR